MTKTLRGMGYVDYGLWGVGPGVGRTLGLVMGDRLWEGGVGLEAEDRRRGGSRTTVMG